jgi:N-methylhydantoinase B
MFGHMTDVGGKVPGSLPTDATSIFEEGVVVPPLKLYRRGELNREALALVLNQVRMKEWNRSDLNAIVAACRTAGRRVIELCERFGTETYLSALDALLERNERAMRQLIATTIPEDKLTFTDYICDDGRGYGPYKIHCTMWREGEKVILDFAGTDPQAEGSINFYLNENMFRMFFGIYMIMVFDPQILWNDGFYPLVDVRIPEGSLLKPRYPAALSCRTHALGRIFDVLGGLLGQRTPEFLNAAGFSSSPHLMYSGVDRRGEWFQLYQIGFGGIPGRPFGDGPDGHSLWPSFTNVPNEFLESYYPLVIERYETVPDSGGPGFFRGGNGIDIAYRFGEPGEISIHDDRWFTYPWGVNGGLPGARSRKLLIRADGSQQVLPSKCDHVRVAEGDVLHYVTWGGGGWGDPFDRDPALVAKEVRQGLVTTEGARRYGVVLAADGGVDEAETQQLRTRLREERGEVKLFDFGPPIEELRARCLEETGLPAPRPPVFRSDGAPAAHAA